MTHVFESQGLGQAPYKYMGCEKQYASCEYCGTSILYKFWLKSADGNEFFVGSDCIEKSGDRGLICEVKAEKKARDRAKRLAKKQAAYEARQDQWKLEKEETKAKFLELHPDCVEVLDWAKNQSGIALNMHDSFNTWGNLSDKQIAFLKTLHEKDKSPTHKTNCPDGKVEIEGTVLGFKTVESQFGLTTKIIVESQEGYRVYGTLPRSINSANIGDKIRFTATVQPSDQDKEFGFFSRPSQSTFV